MKPNQLDRVIKLVRRTGDRVLVMDRDSEEVMAIMNLDEYEKLLGGIEKVEEMSETDFLDKINRDIALWRETHHGEIMLEESELEAEKEAEEFVRERVESVVEPVMEPESLPETAEISQNTIEPEPKVESLDMSGSVLEEDLGDVKNDEEEEKFYIEPIE